MALALRAQSGLNFVIVPLPPPTDRSRVGQPRAVVLNFDVLQNMMAATRWRTGSESRQHH